MSSQEVQPYPTITGYPEDSIPEGIAKDLMNWDKKKIVKELALYKYWERNVNEDVPMWMHQIDSRFRFINRMKDTYEGALRKVIFEPVEYQVQETKPQLLRRPEREVLERTLTTVKANTLIGIERILDRTLLWRQVDKDHREYTEKGKEVIKRR